MCHNECVIMYDNFRLVLYLSYSEMARNIKEIIICNIICLFSIIGLMEIPYFE